MARLYCLDTAKGVAQLASTIGREFSYAWLQALAPWDEATLQRELSRLVEAELLYQRGLLPRATYLFKHALIREAAYESLLRRTRQQYHQKIALALAERFPETAETQPACIFALVEVLGSASALYGTLCPESARARPTDR